MIRNSLYHLPPKSNYNHLNLSLSRTRGKKLTCFVIMFMNYVCARPHTGENVRKRLIA